MPVVHVEMLKGRSGDDKRRLIEEITNVMVDVAGAVRERVTVIVDEVEAENWGRGGVPLSDGAGVDGRRGNR